MPDLPTLRRPSELVLVVILTYLAAVAAIVVGVFLILARYLILPTENLVRELVTIAGAIVVLVGFLLVAVASGLARGDRTSRLLATVLLALSAALSIFAFVVDRDTVWSPAINVLISGGAITVMWAGRASRFFAQTSV